MHVIDMLAQQAAARQPFFVQGSRQLIIWESPEDGAIVEIFNTEPHLVSGPLTKKGRPDQRYKVRENGWCRNSKYSAPLADAIAEGVITEADLPNIPTYLTLPEGFFMPQDVE
jgi:hypothetical protein